MNDLEEFERLLERVVKNAVLYGRYQVEQHESLEHKYEHRLSTAEEDIRAHYRNAIAKAKDEK